MAGLKKIVAIGPESTGKSTLCELLAKHYHTVWCPEYAREYLTANGPAYNYDSLLVIANRQLELEDAYVSSVVNKKLKTENWKLETGNQKPETLFVDTDMYVMKVWCEYVFNRCHHYILEQIASRKYDLYLLCNIDLPWEDDPLREYPDEKPRQELYRIYRDMLINQNTPWVEISGSYEQRLQKAITAVDKLLGT